MTRRRWPRAGAWASTRSSRTIRRSRARRWQVDAGQGDAGKEKAGEDLRVDGDALRPLRREERVDARDRHLVDRDVLGVVAAARPDARQAAGIEERDDLVTDADRDRTLEERHHLGGAVAGLLL